MGHARRAAHRDDRGSGWFHLRNPAVRDRRGRGSFPCQPCIPALCLRRSTRERQHTPAAGQPHAGAGRPFPGRLLPGGGLSGRDDDRRRLATPKDSAAPWVCSLARSSSARQPRICCGRLAPTGTGACWCWALRWPPSRADCWCRACRRDRICAGVGPFGSVAYWRDSGIRSSAHRSVAISATCGSRMPSGHSCRSGLRHMGSRAAPFPD